MKNNCQVVFEKPESEMDDDPDRKSVSSDEEKETEVDSCPVAEMCELRHLCGTLKCGWGEGQTDLI